MTFPTPQVQADGVKHALTSLATCTSSTVSTLNQLLFTKPRPCTDQQNQTTRVAVRATTAGTKTRPGTTKKTRVKAKVTILEISEEKELAACEKFTLATEVCNASIKLLSEAVKSPSQFRRQSTTKDVNHSPKSTAGIRPMPRSVSALQQPLQTLPVNRVSSSPDTSPILRRSSSCASIGPAAGLVATAQCAQLGFAALRSLHAQGIEQAGSSALRLENGMLAFTGKLIDLGIDDMAIKELRILKKRLYTMKGAVDKEMNRGQASLPEKETLASILRFEGVNAEEPELGLMIGVQLHALRLIASRKQYRLIEDVVDNLTLSLSGSPADLILKSLRQDTPPKVAKAARQLETLAQSLLALCPKTPSADDASAPQIVAAVSPRTIFRAQALAFEIRLQWWGLAAHDVNLQRELYEPFAKYLAIFSRRSTDDARMKYDLAVEAYKRFTAGVASMSREVAQSPVNTSLPNIYKSLGNLAQETSLWKDAIQWNVDATHLLNETSTRSLVQNACFCRLTFLHLQLVLAGNHVDGFKASLLQATTCLEGSLHGDSAELDELLMAVAPLRKAAMTFMIRSPPSKNEVGDIDQEMQSTRLLCSELVHVCLKFFIRYIGSAPRGKQAAKALIRYEQRQKFSSLAARSAIESVIACTKISLGTDHISWDKLDSPLQDCARLLLVLDPLPTNTDDAPKTPPDKELLIVKLSNVYWSYYLKRKQALGAPRELAKSLQRSVELLQNRTKLEKTAGFLAIKLERLGALQESLGRMSDALNLFAEAARSHIDDAVLCNAASAAKTRPLLDVWEGGGAIGVFGKAVSSWTKVAVQDASTSEIPFDYGVPSTEERGLLLEWQLTVLSNLDTQAATERHIRSIRILADNLLEIYGAETFPIRRLRLILCLLRIESNHTDILGQVFMGKLSEESGEQLLKVSTTEDRGLARYEIHLKACVTASLALRNDKSSEEGLRSALSLWIGVLDSCETWHCISEKVENGSNWILQLQSILDYLDMQGLETLRVSALHLMAKVRELQEPLECSALVRSMSDLGLQYLRLGYSGRAGHALVRAVNYVETWDVSIEVKLQWYLAYAEYLVEIGNSEKCEEYLIIASQAADEDTELMKNAGLSATLPQRVRLNRLIANASYVYALLAFSKSRSEEAVAFAKNCLRLVYRAWSGLEHQKCNKTKPTYTDHEKNHFSGLSESFSMLAVATCPMPVIMSTTHQSLKGPPFWTLIPTLYRGLALVSKIFAHQGMFLETVYYTEQAQKAVDAVGAGPWVAQNLAVGGDHWTRSRDLQKGSACLFQARDLTLQMENTRHTATLHYHLANMYRVQCSLEDEAEAYKSAHNTLRRLTPTEAIQRLRRLSTGQRELESQMAKLAVKDNHSTKQAAAKRPIRQPTKGRTRSRDKSLEKTVPKQQNLANECNTLLRLKGDILRQHALAMVFQQDLENATSMLAQAEELPKSHQGLVQQRLANAKKLLLHGLKSMSADAVFCVLSESTISFPAVANTVKGRENKAQDQSPTRVVRSPPRKIDIKQASRRGAKVKSPGTDDFVDILCQARDNILDVQATAMETCSSHTLHIISNTLTSLLMLLSASCWTKSKTVVNPYLAIYSRGLIPWPFSVTEANDELEVARIVALQRERASIQFNKRPTSQEEMLKWPRSASQSVSESMDLRMPLNYSSFQRDYVDIIPVAWKVISVSLSEARDEIHICKLQKGLNPFVLRLPLGRHNSRDADEDTFGFDHGSAEILEITELANFSAQDARNMSRSGAKSAWWAEREALDERLKALLANIENVWLSGFRGVFSSQKRHPELLSRFQHSFQNILDKYLPSRQAFGKRSKAGRVNLDSRILELFVSLGAPVDSSELEEPLTDLLYFVVDVLQFNGERNAYDEVDFDSIIIETTDAIRCYHEAAQADIDDNVASHTILILDKLLHVFPWESLSCLDGQSVSRLPSLGCLRQRLLRQRQNARKDSPDRSYVDGSNGTYVLNPSGDLKSTQAAFERPFQTLTTWEKIVQREPSEAEFKNALESRDLFLYLGHGSGAQYIRSKTIRELDRCAVSLLMGCSSGTLTEVGEFEPYGTPINYMHAGSSALVATLWDVTDKDIDRFSWAVLHRWGLFNGSITNSVTSPVKQGGRRRVPSKAREASTASDEPMSLVEAVAKGRSSCTLRYLNGAAPVVYGIPVYLS